MIVTVRYAISAACSPALRSNIPCGLQCNPTMHYFVLMNVIFKLSLYELAIVILCDIESDLEFLSVCYSDKLCVWQRGWMCLHATTLLGSQRVQIQLGYTLHE